MKLLLLFFWRPLRRWFWFLSRFPVSVFHLQVLPLSGLRNGVLHSRVIVRHSDELLLRLILILLLLARSLRARGLRLRLRLRLWNEDLLSSLFSLLSSLFSLLSSLFFLKGFSFTFIFVIKYFLRDLPPKRGKRVFYRKRGKKIRAVGHMPHEYIGFVLTMFVLRTSTSNAA